MKREEIQRKHKDIVKRRKALNREIEKLLLEWRQLQLECNHENKYPTSVMGDSGVHCPDCGYST